MPPENTRRWLEGGNDEEISRSRPSCRIRV